MELLGYDKGATLDQFELSCVMGLVLKALDDGMPKYLDCKDKWMKGEMDDRDFDAGCRDYISTLEDMYVTARGHVGHNGFDKKYPNLKFDKNGRYVKQTDL
jgi:hypothetical protein